MRLKVLYYDPDWKVNPSGHFLNKIDSQVCVYQLSMHINKDEIKTAEDIIIMILLHKQLGSIQ